MGLSNIKIINDKINLFYSIDKKFYENKNENKNENENENKNENENENKNENENQHNNYKDHLNIVKTKFASITIRLIYKYLSIYLPELCVKQNENNISKLNWRSRLNLNLTNSQHHSQTD